MTIWILLIFRVGDTPVAAIEYSSQQACERARTAISAAYEARGFRKPLTLCTRK